MSVAARLISGSAASWAQIAVNMIAQLALVPIYLLHWNVKTYGIWLAILAMVNFLSMVDYGHQQFLGYEFLRIGRENREELSKYLWSGVVFAILISLGQVLLVVIFLFSGALPVLLGESNMPDSALMHSAGIVLLLQSGNWLIVVTVSGLITRVLAPFGYYPRVAWWGFLYAIINALAPLIAVVLGADLLVTGIVASCAVVGYGIPMYIDFFGLMRKEQIRFSRPSWKVGYNNFLHSLVLSGKSLFENIRQQGTRLVLAPLSGAAGLAAFATMRTGANVALQGLNTIVNPLMPDLMRFLHQRDQIRTEVAFGTVWIVIIALMSPGVVILQTIIEPLYTLWTRGKIPFDPSLFAILSLSVLVYAVTQPAIAVVIGNNMLKPQLALSCVAGIIVGGGIFVLVPIVGIVGAGISLLVAEIIVSVGYLTIARKWLNNNSLLWPKQAFGIAVFSVCIAAVSMASLILFPEVKWLIITIAILLFAWNLRRYWYVLPDLATSRAREFITKLPGIKLFLGKNY